MSNKKNATLGCLTPIAGFFVWLLSIALLSALHCPPAIMVVWSLALAIAATVICIKYLNRVEH